MSIRKTVPGAMGTVTDPYYFELSSANSTRIEGGLGEKFSATRSHLVVGSKARWARNRILRGVVIVVDDDES